VQVRGHYNPSTVRRVWGVENVTVEPRVRLLRRRDARCRRRWRLQLQQRHPDSYADCNTHFNAHTNSDAQTSSNTQTAPEAPASSNSSAGYTTASPYTPSPRP
jgi:hypothetical protein